MKSKRILIFILLLTTSLCTFSQKKIEFNRIVDGQAFTQNTYTDLYSRNDGDHYTILENNRRIVEYSYKTGLKTTIIFDIEDIKPSPISEFSDYQFSNKETKILLTTKKQLLNRYSFAAKYYIWNSITKELTPLSEYGTQQVPAFSPDEERIAFVRDRNIFIKSLKFGTENQITRDGKANEITNGFPDWINEEEFNLIRAFEWSSDSKFLAFLKYDETEVPSYNMTMYKGSSPALDQNTTYPGTETFKYSKAGEKNSKVSVNIYEIKSKTIVHADLGKGSDIYIPRIQWTPDANDLAIMKLNRRQNQVDVLMANPYTGDTRPFITEKNKRYITEDFFDFFKFLPDNKYLIINSERDGFSHLYLYNRQGFEIKQLTKGEFDVTDFYGFDPIRKLFYYQAAKESPMRREVYYTSLDGKKSGKLSTMNGTNCAAFSKGFDYYINTFNSIETPKLITLHEWKSKQLRVLENNSNLKNEISNYAIGQKEFFQFSTSESIKLNGWLIKPSDFDANKEYPVLLKMYGGPNSQEVLDEWSIDWSNYLAENGILVACVDPRGTGARGEDFKKSTYMQLGKYESEDLIQAALYLGGLPFVDKNRIATYGWSYGGYTSILCMEKGADVFKAGIAVGPVTDWRFYDSVYTERYMRTPQENPDGYKESSALSEAHKIKGYFLLIHGTADNNVHLQNTIEFAEKMIQAGVQFDEVIYPNRNHNIRGGNTRQHLYTKMTNFLKENLK